MLRRRMVGESAEEVVSGQLIYGYRSSQIVVSNDFGATFKRSTSATHDYIYSIKMGGKGKYILILGSTFLQFSNDYGATFRTIRLSSQRVNFASMTHDCKIAFLVDNSDFYNSVVIKVDLERMQITSSKNEGFPFGEIGVDKDGKFLVVPLRNSKSVRVSSDYGQSWNHLNLSKEGNPDYRLTSMSREGRYVAMGGFTGPHYPPRRYHGNTYSGWKIWGFWTPIVGVHVSYDGKDQFIYADDGVYKSSDYGANFVKKSLEGFDKINPNARYGFSVSAETKYVYVAGNNGALWRSRDGGESFLRINSDGGEFSILATD